MRPGWWWLVVAVMLAGSACVRMSSGSGRKQVSSGDGPPDASPTDLLGGDGAVSPAADVGPRADAAADVGSLPDAGPPPDAARPGPDVTPPCLTKQASFSTAIQCPVFYTCCAKCVDSAGAWLVECTSTDCVCSLNGKNLRLCGTTSCQDAITKNCCKR